MRMLPMLPTEGLRYLRPDIARRHRIAIAPEQSLPVYGNGTTACAWLEYELSVPDESMAVVT